MRKKNADIKKVKQILDFFKLVKKSYKIPVIIFNTTIFHRRSQQSIKNIKNAR